MVDYLQRLINRAQGTADKHPVVLPPMRGPSIEGIGKIEDPFNEVSPMDSAEATTTAPLFVSSEADTGESHNQFQEREKHKPLSTNFFPKSFEAKVNESITAPAEHGQATTQSNISLGLKRPEKNKSVTSASAAEYRTSSESISSGRQGTMDRSGIQSPLPGMHTGTSKPVLLDEEKALQPTRSPNEHRSFLQEEPISPLHTPSNGAPKTGTAEKSEMQESTLRQNAAPVGTVVSSSIVSSRSGATTRSRENNMNSLRPRENAVSNPLPSRQPPRLVIGRLQVDVVQTPAEAPPLQPVREATCAARRQKKHFKRLPSKLRFGLGQL